MRRREGIVDYHSYVKIDRISPRLSGDCLTLSMDFQNVSSRNIAGFVLSISLLDDFNDPILIDGNEKTQRFYDTPDFESAMHIRLTDVIDTTEEPAQIESFIASVRFEDGEEALWQKPRKKIYFYEAFEKDRYKDKPYIEKLSAYVRNPVCFAEKRTDGWLCCCGRLNRNQDDSCPQCLSNRKMVLMDCTKEAIKEEIRKENQLYRKNKSIELAKRQKEEKFWDWMSIAIAIIVVAVLFLIFEFGIM